MKKINLLSDISVGIKRGEIVTLLAKTNVGKSVFNCLMSAQ